MIFTKSDSDLVDGILDNGTFWNINTIKKSTPDGHYTLYSVVESQSSQIGRLRPVSVDELIDIVRDETIERMEYYSHFLL